MYQRHTTNLRHISEEVRPNILPQNSETAIISNLEPFNETSTDVKATPSTSVMVQVTEIVLLEDNVEAGDRNGVTPKAVAVKANSQEGLSKDKLRNAPIQQTKRHNTDPTLPSSCLSSTAEWETPLVPRRTTSMVKPAKRKRHADLVAFHRHSCQLFSSLDGTLEQLRLSNSSLLSVSSTLSATSALSSTPSGPNTRNTSLDDASSSPLSSQRSKLSNNENTLDIKAALKRPSLKRSYRNKLSSLTDMPVHTSDGFINLHNDSRPDFGSNWTASPSSTFETKSLPKSRPTVTTTKSYCSSQRTHSDAFISNKDCSPRNPTFQTTIHWTSPETRRREHAKIDSANSGFRLFLRRIFPRVLSRKVGGGRAGFWNYCPQCNDENDDDARSVRRFRVGIDDDEHLVENIDEETTENAVHLPEGQKPALATITDLELAPRKHNNHHKDPDPRTNDTHRITTTTAEADKELTSTSSPMLDADFHQKHTRKRSRRTNRFILPKLFTRRI